MTTYIVIAMLIGLMQCFIQHFGKKYTSPQYPNLVSYLLFYDDKTNNK